MVRFRLVSERARRDVDSSSGDRDAPSRERRAAQPGEPGDGLGDAEFFEMSHEHLCVAGFDGYWKRLNPSWQRTLGWTREEMMSRPLVEFAHPDDREGVLSSRRRIIEGTPLVNHRNRYRCRDGTYRWFEWISVADPERQLVYAAARDVTDEIHAGEERERLQRQLILADRMVSLGTLAAGVAHEINNPLAYVLANVEMLVEEIGGMDAAALPAQAADWLQLAREAREGAGRIREIVRSLMTFSRAEKEKRVVLDVQPVIELAIRMSHNQIRHRARLVRDYGPMPNVEADESRLGQVFINLLVNAAQAVPEGNADGQEIRIVTSTDDAGRAVVEVRDTGPGIPEDVLSRIFDPFFTTKPIGVGTGLGLSICHGLVTSMGGQITAANGPTRGAVFRVALPAASARDEGASAGRAGAVAACLRGAAVLVVDDERAVGVSLARVLRGHDVTVVTSAKEALDRILADEHFDVVLADLMMPEMSGMDLYDELARRRPRLAERMVFVTGGAFTPAAKEFLDRVPNERLDKPFTTAAVRALVERLAKGAADRR